jgi:polyribonucleotide nucleotidyltransferase
MNKPIAGVELGLAADGSFIVNPTNVEKAMSPLNIAVAGTKEGILMIEGAGDFVPEDIVIQAITSGHAAVGVVCDGIAVLQRVAGMISYIRVFNIFMSQLLFDCHILV